MNQAMQTVATIIIIIIIISVQQDLQVHKL